MSKYHNKKTVVDGITFDSLKESRYYLFLKDKVKSGEIADLQMQVPFEVIPAVYGEKTVIKHLKKVGLSLIRISKEMIKKFVL